MNTFVEVLLIGVQSDMLDDVEFNVLAGAMIVFVVPSSYSVNVLSDVVTDVLLTGVIIGVGLDIGVDVLTDVNVNESAAAMTTLEFASPPPFEESMVLC